MALGSMQYVPVVKARAAEIGALLTAPASLQVTPLFELQNAAAPRTNTATGQVNRSKSSATDASYFLDDIARLWSGPLYVDACRVAAPAARGGWWQLLAALNAIQATPATLMPVVSDHEPPASRQLAAGLAAAAGRAALRVRLPHPNPASLAGELAAAAADLQLPASSVDVVLDWEDQMEPHIVSLDNLEAHSNAVIAGLGGQHGDLITVGTPNSGDFVQVGDWNRTRREWQLWLRLAHAGIDVTYGDYVLYPPADPAPAAPSYGHLRYSSGDQLWVHRRARPAGGGGLAAAFAACCTHLVGQPHYLGPGFSDADRTIEAIAARTVQMGAAGDWRQLAAEHHLAVVNDQLGAPPAAPAPGTP
jgi:hypothetical protein